MKNKGRIMRIAAAVIALALTAGYFLLPVSDSLNSFTNSGRKKMTLDPGETCSWSWTPELEGANELHIFLSGIQNAQEITVSAELRDGDKTVSSAKRTVAEMTEEYLLLKGSFERGKAYTLLFWTEGEGTLKVKGAPDEETGEFYPMLNEIARSRIYNPTLLYFAAGALLAAATPVFDEAEIRNRRRHRKAEKTFTEKALPWAALGMTMFFGIFLTAVKPMFDAGSGWMTWDEDIHWAAVQGMSLFQEGGIRSLAAKTVTWNPGYLPMAAAFSLGKIFTSDLALLYRLSVGTNAMVYALMCWAAVRHAPRYKACFLAAGSIPALLFQMTSVTYDTMAAGSILLGLALALESADREEKLSASRAIFTVSLLAFGTVAFPALSLSLLCLMIIPRDKFGSDGKAWVFRCFVLLMTAWCLAAVLMPGAYDDVKKGNTWLTDENVQQQLAYIAGAPGDGLTKPLVFLILHPDLMMIDGLSRWGKLGFNNVWSEVYAVILLLVAPLCSTGEDLREESFLTPGRRFFLIAASLGAELLLAWVNYLVISEPGGPLIGMSGRFFMPLWILFCLGAMRSHGIRKLTGKAGEWLSIPVFLICFAVNLLNMLEHLQAVR